MSSTVGRFSPWKMLHVLSTTMPHAFPYLACTRVSLVFLSRRDTEDHTAQWITEHHTACRLTVAGSHLQCKHAFNNLSPLPRKPSQVARRCIPGLVKCSRALPNTACLPNIARGRPVCSWSSQVVCE
jgi:hypothetical protein